MKLIREILSRKRIVIDICLNIAAVTLPLAMLQLVIYPQIAKQLGGQEYGLMLTIFSIWAMLPSAIGNVFNNVKLIRFQEYQKHGIEGDFPILLRRWTLVTSVVVFVMIWVYSGSFSVVRIIIGTFIGILMLLKGYLEAWFRIELNYISILLSNGFLSVGYLLGFIIFRYTSTWEWIFLLGYLLPCIYCVTKAPLLKEACQKTFLYPAVKKDLYSLGASNVIANLTGYADKLLLYPLMGGVSVSIYYTATILGKITGMLTGPINGVILSYISRWDKSKSGYFTVILWLSFAIGLIGYALAILLARPVIGFLFPQWLEAVMEIIPLTTVAVMLGIVAGILNPFIMKYCELQWQTIISACSSFVYFGSALILWNYFGLKGFCIGTILGVLSKLILMIFVYYKTTECYKSNEVS